MARDRKEYPGHGFEVEPTKLTKLLKVMHEKLPGTADDQTDSFTIYMVGNHTVRRHTLEEVLALDNSARHRIVRLQIQCSSHVPGASPPQSEIEVDFGATLQSSTANTGGGPQMGVSVEVAGDSSAW